MSFDSSHAVDSQFRADPRDGRHRSIRRSDDRRRVIHRSGRRHNVVLRGKNLQSELESTIVKQPESQQPLYDQQMAVYVLEKGKAASWSDVKPELQHDRLHERQSRLRRYRRRRSEVKWELSEIPSTTIRKIIHEFVEEENEKLRAHDKTIRWDLTHLEVQWRTMRGGREIKRVTIWLEIEPSDGPSSDSLEATNTTSSAKKTTCNHKITYVPRSESGRMLDITAGDHLVVDQLTGNININDILPYRSLGTVGQGENATVDKIRDIHTDSIYARKVFRGVHLKDMRKIRQALKSSVKMLNRFGRNSHVIGIHATYILRQEYAIVYDTLADGGNLADFLTDYREKCYNGETPDIMQNNILCQSFGCLASALAFMHDKCMINHNNIKPQNILIHRGKVMYTDFQLSNLSRDTRQSTTASLVSGSSQRYHAPEVVDEGIRTGASDIFSLGCVYAEIFDALCPGWLREELLVGPFYKTTTSLRSKGLSNWQKSGTAFQAVHRLMESSIDGMLQASPAKRPHAADLARKFYRFKFVCEECEADRLK